MRDIRNTNFGARMVGFACVGGIIGPPMFFVGIGSSNIQISSVGTFAFCLPYLFCLHAGINAFKDRVKSDYYAYAILPLSILLLSTTGFGLYTLFNA